MTPVHRSNIPAARTTLIGREDDLARLIATVRDGSCRLITLIGAGGSGKTAIALEAARSQQRELVDGAWFVDLSSLTQTDDVAEACCAALGLTDPARPPLARLVDALAGSDALIVLDNCEHLQSSAAAVANALLDGCPEVRLLTTSREVLGVKGEQVIRVMPLALPQPGGRLEDAASTQLFLARARALRPELVLEGNEAAIADICVRVDGLPLAIELAAANITVMSPAQIARRLSLAHELLPSRDLTRPDRHRTMEAAIAWGHALLDESDTKVFRRLSVFANGWTLAAAERTCAFTEEEAPNVAGSMQRLVERSMIVRDESEPPRFRWLQLLREFASRKLDEAVEREATEQAHVAFYLALAEATYGRPGHAPASAFRVLVEEYPNLHKAAEVATTRGDFISALRCHNGLVPYYRLRDLRSGITAMQSLLKLALPTRARFPLLIVLADFTTLAGDFALAEQAADEAAEIAAERADADWQFYAAGVRGILAGAQGRFDEARLQFEVARKFAEDDETMAWWHANRGLMEYEAGAFENAREHLEEADRLWSDDDPSWFRGQITSRRGSLSVLNADSETGRDLLLRAISWLGSYGAAVELADALIELAAVDATEARPFFAARILGAADALANATGAQLSAVTRQHMEAATSRTRESLGETAFAREWAHGRAMTLDEAVSAVLSGEKGQAPVSSVLDVLTAREREVAKLVAEGLTNPKIAERLEISPGTTRIHVERILRKLGLASRVQVATAVKSETAS